RWFSHYEGQSAQHVERAVQRFTPEARGVTNARDYIPLVTSRLQRGIAQWRETGQAPADMPEEFASGGMPGMTAQGLIGGLVGGALSAIGGAVSSAVSGAASAVSNVGRALFKAREGGVAEGADPETIKSQLGSGRSLDGSAKSQMESAFGANFSSVRIHTDAKAQALSNSLNARAFTIGSDIAFGAGEYNPGTLVGDALIAHELAHVAQQQGGESGATLPLQKGHGDSSALEDDADNAAVGAVVGLWGRSKLAMSHAGTNAMPRLKSRLQLQRCSSSRPSVRSPADIQSEFDTVYRQITDSLPEGATRDQLSRDLFSAQLAYDNELARAGNDASRQAQVQQTFHNNLERMRQTAPLQAQLATRYNIQFTTRTVPYLHEGQMREGFRAWTTEELRAIDAALSRVPRNYLSNIRTIQRGPQELDATVGAEGSTPRPDAAASWQQSERTLHIFNLFFTMPEYLRLGALLHEIGHSTVTSPVPTTPQDFTSLPPPAWMALSDWKTATTATLATSVGINQTQATDLIAELTRNKRTQGGSPRPVERNRRMIVYDKYEASDMNRPPTRFLHYRSGTGFVSDYARTHPAEDLAESFSRYLHDPPIAVFQTSARELMGDAKWRYLEANYPQRLQNAP
ncbi:MAG TPA: DUF4157 domain-containing protein, partial [Pyrinomonadaceae bacterium]|nr:DUF4157 domain-containing protein [Pyrinomonadaceae bacterium]